jgi:DNA-binding PadR family transcriptional regulator
MQRELLLLGLLRQQEMHGYKLMEFIEGSLAICTDLKKPTAYFLLEKMEQKGWVTRSTAQEGNRPTRNIYSITPVGEQIFQQTLRESLASYSSAKFEDDVALAFMESLPPDECLALLRQKRAALEAELDASRLIPTHEGAAQYLIEHRQFYLESELRWLDQLLTRLSASA